MSKIVDPIMFAGGSNLVSLIVVNKELQHIDECFKANKLPLNLFLQKSTKKDHIPLKLSKLHINESIIYRKYEVKFLGIILDENLCWKKHINLIENKISKNIGKFEQYSKLNLHSPKNA